MAKKPDLSDLTKKFDIGGIVDNIKSLVNPGGDTPNVDPSDALGIKIANISVLIQKLVNDQQEHTKSLAEINKQLNAAFKDLEAIRAAHPSEKPAPKKEAEPAADATEEKKPSEEADNKDDE